jgi:hypothetical protein
MPSGLSSPVKSQGGLPVGAFASWRATVFASLLRGVSRKDRPKAISVLLLLFAPPQKNRLTLSPEVRRISFYPVRTPGK